MAAPYNYWAELRGGDDVRFNGCLVAHRMRSCPRWVRLFVFQFAWCATAWGCVLVSFEVCRIPSPTRRPIDQHGFYSSHFSLLVFDTLHAAVYIMFPNEAVLQDNKYWTLWRSVVYAAAEAPDKQSRNAGAVRYSLRTALGSENLSRSDVGGLKDVVRRLMSG